MPKGVLCLMALAILSSSAHGESRRTYYTDERVAAARENVATYDWAGKQLARIVEHGDAIRYYIGPTYTSAKTFAAQTDEFMWLLQPTTKIPRIYDFSHTRALCPVHGKEGKKRFNVWCPWNIDPIGHPYQIQCMVGKEWYPSNRYHEGDMTSGEFPDDGNGCLYEGQRYYFLREYAHMAYGSVVVPTLSALSEAWLLTGDPVYAHKGCILLARLASEYPNYGWEGTDFADLENRFEQTYCGPWDNKHPYPLYSWKHGGMITDLIWSTFKLEAEAYAYDALREFMDDPDVLAFLRSKGMSVESGDDLRGYIENYILRAGAQGLLTGEVHGNQGHHQAAAMALALVLDDYGDRHPNSTDLVDYAYHGTDASAYILVNGLTRDGGGHESPSYNRIKFDFIRVAQLMEMVRARRPGLFPEETYPDIFAHPKARSLFDHYIDAVILDIWWPRIGDTGNYGKPARGQEASFRYSFAEDNNLYAFERYGDPRYARAATSHSGEVFPGDLWTPFPEERIKEALQDPRSHIVRGPRLLDGYGLAILESGVRPHNRALTLNYSSTVGHRQDDQLVVDLWANDLELLPDLGYPRTWDFRAQWDKNNMAHNTVTVDERPYGSLRFLRHGCRLFASADGVHVVNAYSNPYVEGTRFEEERELPCDLFERTCVLVEVDSARFYVVDLFAVRGGHQHDQSWHGMYVEPEMPDLDWQAQGGGTLAGADVPEFGGYTDEWGNRYDKGNFPSYVTNVRRARLAEPADWTWTSGLPEGDALALHVVPLDGPAEVIMGKGRSPVWAEEGKLDFLFVRRGVADGGASRFLTVLAPYQREPVVQAVRVTSQRPLVIEVQRADGTDEISLATPTDPSRTTAHRALGVRVKSPGRDVEIGRYAPDAGPGYLSATIEAVAHDDRRIEVPYTPAAEEALMPGRWIRIFNERRSGMFRIEQAARDDDRLRLTLRHSPLVARFPVTGVDEGRLKLGVSAPWVTGLVDKETGRLTDGANDYYYGCWLGQGSRARAVEGISRTKPAWLHLADPTSDDDLKGEFLGKVVSLWDYNIGDRVEVALIRD